MPRNQPQPPEVQEEGRQPQLPPMRLPTIAALKEDIQMYKADFVSKATDMDFETWLRATRPQQYQVYRKLEGRGR